MAFVENVTGINQHSIRAWERRYSAINPGRNDKGRRVFFNNDIERLKRLKKLTDAGMQISEIASMKNTELDRLYHKHIGGKAGSFVPENGFYSIVDGKIVDNETHELTQDEIVCELNDLSSNALNNSVALIKINSQVNELKDSIRSMIDNARESKDLGKIINIGVAVLTKAN